MSGSGSAYVAIVDDEHIDDVKGAWADFDTGEIIETVVNNDGTKFVG